MTYLRVLSLALLVCFIQANPIPEERPLSFEETIDKVIEDTLECVSTKVNPIVGQMNARYQEELMELGRQALGYYIRSVVQSPEAFPDDDYYGDDEEYSDYCDWFDDCESFAFDDECQGDEEEEECDPTDSQFARDQLHGVLNPQIDHPFYKFPFDYEPKSNEESDDDKNPETDFEDPNKEFEKADNPEDLESSFDEDSVSKSTDEVTFEHEAEVPEINSEDPNEDIEIEDIIFKENEPSIEDIEKPEEFVQDEDNSEKQAENPEQNESFEKKEVDDEPKINFEEQEAHSVNEEADSE